MVWKEFWEGFWPFLNSISNELGLATVIGSVGGYVALVIAFLRLLNRPKLRIFKVEHLGKPDDDYFHGYRGAIYCGILFVNCRGVAVNVLEITARLKTQTKNGKRRKDTINCHADGVRSLFTEEGDYRPPAQEKSMDVKKGPEVDSSDYKNPVPIVLLEPFEARSVSVRLVSDNHLVSLPIGKVKVKVSCKYVGRRKKASRMLSVEVIERPTISGGNISNGLQQISG